MVVSLESQNVRVRKSYHAKNIKLNIFPDISQLQISLDRLTSNINVIIYIFSLFWFSLIFYMYGDHFILSKKVILDVSQITLPDHDPDILSRENIARYKSNSRTNLFSDYTFLNGDTLSSIAIKYNLSRNTLLHVNRIYDLKELQPGMKLKVPAVNGILHNIIPRDSLESISNKYNIPVKDIFRINGLKSETLTEGSFIFIPNVNASEWGWKSNIDKFFVYPVNGQIIKRYGQYTNNITGITELYEGIDIKASDDNRIFASKSGYVSGIGYSPNYGNYIFVDHNGGMRTLYAHLKEIKVSNRDKVKQGHVIGIIGDSGYAKTEKLFFCILDGNSTVDPEKYLK